MKSLCKVESNIRTAYTNFNKCETVKGCFRDKWSHDESSRIVYYLVKIDDNIKYITFKGYKGYLARRKDMFITKKGDLPSSANKSNTMVKILYV